MTRRRGNRPCTRCSRPTKSATHVCHRCRCEDDPPRVVLVAGGLIAFGGLTLTVPQARRLADAIHDTIDDTQEAKERNTNG